MDKKDSPKESAEVAISRPKGKGAFGVIAGIILLVAGWYGYTYASTPAHIRKPAFQHYHFRTQILVDGKAVDFSEDKFQEKAAAATTCSAAVSSSPIHFHDRQDQLTHVHWAKMTGGEFLKYYGWNYIGGSDDVLGHRYDSGLLPKTVKIYGRLLPSVPKAARFYVYTGDKNKYEQKNWQGFLKQDLETFFGKKSNIGHKDVGFNIFSKLSAKALAHAGDTLDEEPSDKSDEELTRINNLVGNVVIFAQEKEPTAAEVQARFNKLVPLRDSTCGD